jgi:hypothetical protein
VSGVKLMGSKLCRFWLQQGQARVVSASAAHLAAALSRLG